MKLNRLACLALAPVLAPVWAAAIAPVSLGATVGYLKLEGQYPERHSMPPFLMMQDGEVTFRELVEALEEAADRPRALDGLMIRISDLTISTTQIEEIGTALESLREGGTRIHVFTEIYGPAELLLGSFADDVIIQKGGSVTLPGLYLEEMFLADALGAIGVRPDFVQVGDYKGASEPIANSEPSPKWNENIDGLLDGLYANLREHLSEGRSLSPARLDEAMEASVLANDTTAIEVGLVDAAVDRSDLDEHLERMYDDSIRWDARVGPSGASAPDFASMGFFEAFSQLMLMMEPMAQGTSRDTIAVVHIDGAIVDGESQPAGLTGGASVGSQTIREVLGDLEKDENVKGVVVRINSPGGSAIASESIWLGLQRLAEDRPVWTSVGDMAASGGYYIAVASQRIFVAPSSIVGSIGVVGGKLALEGLYDKLHINVVPRARGPRASMLGMLAPWSPTERELIRQKMTETYDLFVRRVEAGREGIDIDRTAEGRLFTGVQAIELEMADDLGGLDDAIIHMARDLGLEEGAYDVIDYPPPPTFDEFLEQAFPMLAGARASPSTPLVLESMRELLGPIAFDQLMDHIAAMMQLRREPVLLTSPRVLIRR